MLEGKIYSLENSTVIFLIDFDLLLFKNEKYSNNNNKNSRK